MFERTAKRTRSTSSSGASSSSMSIGTDLSRDPVFLSGKVIPSVSFARAMLTLGNVVRIQKPKPKDHSAYQDWVSKQYLKILEDRLPRRSKQQKALREEISRLVKEEERLEGELRSLEEFEGFSKAREKFFDWLYEHDRSSWIELDPIVSVQNNGTYFEAFSGDESIYARVFLPHEAVELSTPPRIGATNIDFSPLLGREFERVRSYRPLNLTVGVASVDIATEANTVREEKIELPETWVRGLVEVQSVMSLPSTNFEMSADALAEVIAKLQSERERHGPRSLRFMLEPGKPIRVHIEPWGHVFADDWCNYDGEKSVEVRVWGRRRLEVLSEILVKSQRVKVQLLGSGMPSFWTVVNDGIELTVGLSGWVANDWASKARFSSFLPEFETDDKALSMALDHVVESGGTSTQQLSEQLKISQAKAAGVLQKLCLRGKLMFDPTRSRYLSRDLFPGLEISSDGDSSLEEREGIKLARSHHLVIESRENLDGIQKIAGRSETNDRVSLPTLELDADYRPKYAQCTCSFFSYNKLRRGPCRHLIALSILGGM